MRTVILSRIRGILARFHPRRVILTLRWLARLPKDIRRRRREARLTVAVDIAAFWEPLTGVGWYLYELLQELAPRTDLCLRLYGPTLFPSRDLLAAAAQPPRGPAIEVVSYPIPEDLTLPAHVLAKLLRRLAPLLIAADGNRVLFAPNYFLPHHFSLARGKLVITVLDLSLHRVPWTMRDETLRELKAHLHGALQRADRVITISRTVQDELIHLGYTGAGRIAAIYLGPRRLTGDSNHPTSQPTPVRYALFVGTVEPRKNLGLLLEAWWMLHRRGQDPPTLLVCGRLGWKSEELQRELTRAQEAGLARHLGYVADSELATLYRHALFVVFPSLYEGFGLPVVEAMSAGVPVLCSDIAVLREVAGDAALFASPDHASAWAAQVDRLAKDEELRRLLVEKGRSRVRRFSWSRAASETVEIWRQAAEAA